MAVTGFWPVKGQLRDLLDYTNNPEKTVDRSLPDDELYRTIQYASDEEKTEKTMYVRGINCSKQYAYEAIKQCLSRQRKMIAEIYGLDWVKGEKRVFPSLQGKLILPSTMNCHLSRICTRLGIERRTVHSLRDSFATRFIEADGSPQILKSLLGHTSYSMTMDRYSQVMDEVKASEMQKVKII